MHVEENRRSRRLVVRVTRGESLVTAIEAACRDHAVSSAFVQGHGVVARATLDTRLPMKPTAPRRTVEGPLELVAVTGDVASHEGRLTFDGTVQLAMHADHGIVLVGGHLVDAEAEGVTILIDCLDDLGLRREAERPTGLLGFRVEGSGAPTTSARAESRTPRGREVGPTAAMPEVRPRPANDPKPLPADNPWAAVVAASSERRAEASAGERSAPSASDRGPSASLDDGLGDAPDDEADVPMPAAGDYVDHRQFGLCRVDRATPDGELLIRLEGGRRKEIRLDFLEVLPPRKDGPRRIFPLRPRKG